MSSRSDITDEDVQKALVGGQQAQIDFKVFRERNPTALIDKKKKKTVQKVVLALRSRLYSLKKMTILLGASQR